MIRKIITVPNPILRQKTKPIPPVGGRAFNKKVEKLVNDLIETARAAKKPEGVGLSAIQIGELKRVFVVKRGSKFVSFINPKITWISKKKFSQTLKKEERFLEGCLSVPGYFAFVDRPFSVKLKWQDLSGQVFEEKFENKESAYVQHELDHLNGILFTDHAVSQKQKIYQIKKDKEGKDILVEVQIK